MSCVWAWDACCSLNPYKIFHMYSAPYWMCRRHANYYLWRTWMRFVREQS